MTDHKLECLFLGHIPDLNKCWEGSSECPGQRFTGETICKRCGSILIFCPQSCRADNLIYSKSNWRTS